MQARGRRQEHVDASAKHIRVSLAKSPGRTAVKRAFRGRGIAVALKRAQITWAASAEFERLETLNELRNEPILQLNKRFGYREAPGRISLRGPLAE